MSGIINPSGFCGPFCVSFWLVLACTISLVFVLARRKSKPQVSLPTSLHGSTASVGITTDKARLADLQPPADPGTGAGVASRGRPTSPLRAASLAPPPDAALRTSRARSVPRGSGQRAASGVHGDKHEADAAVSALASLAARTLGHPPGVMAEPNLQIDGTRGDASQLVLLNTAVSSVPADRRVSPADTRTASAEELHRPNLHVPDAHAGVPTPVAAADYQGPAECLGVSPMSDHITRSGLRAAFMSTSSPSVLFSTTAHSMSVGHVDGASPRSRSSSRSPRLFGRRRAERRSPPAVSPDELPEPANSVLGSLAAQSLNILIPGSSRALFRRAQRSPPVETFDSSNVGGVDTSSGCVPGRPSLRSGFSEPLISRPTTSVDEPKTVPSDVSKSPLKSPKKKSPARAFIVRDRHTQMANWAQKSWGGVESKERS